MPSAQRNSSIRKVLLLGSGGLKIGQAGEFDYSGSQAIKALKEEGIEVILINPNIATIQTSQGMADKTYFLPLTIEFIEEVIKKERPDSLLLSFGGQTALNCGVELYTKGILEKYHVTVLGTPVETIMVTEDRDLFVKKLNEIGVKSPRSLAVSSVDTAILAAQNIGYPVMVRAAYALGGMGSGICRNEDELITRCQNSFAQSPQVLIEEWLGGWKEIEYEVVRDNANNCITVCNMENLDPLGIHTGESIVVAPSQTLTNTEYHLLREVALKVIRHLGIVGECNIQYALDPYSQQYRVIEVNARLSRSSALASKATGYPLAYVAAKLAIGYTLPQITNRITQKTQSCFEPALDYIVVKIPRWDLQKFENVDTRIGTEMKSVGEVMAIGRSFPEALQKALRMLGTGLEGIVANSYSTSNILVELENPTDKRILAVAQALEEGWGIERVHELTKIDCWFLEKIHSIVSIKKNLTFSYPLNSDFSEILLEAKRHGFSDTQIATILGLTPLVVRTLRKSYNILPVVKQIDTLAAEFPSSTNYLYCTYNGSENDVTASSKGIIVLGGGSYRIGSSVEFDWCCVNAVNTARTLGHTTIMINCNPETVSTDYDVCDKLYFEELNFERVLDIYEFEHPDGIIISMGGQIPNNLALPLYQANCQILGTAPVNIDRAEDRHKFSSLLDKLGIDQPAWKELTTITQAIDFARSVKYPVLIRPSYVLSGAAMKVVWDDASLEKYLTFATQLSPDHPVVMSKFIENAKEIEVDAVAQNGSVVIYAISEHIENAGVHSGDATLVLPAQRLYVETIRRIKKIMKTIAQELNITGPLNIQFLAHRNHVKVIECNVRASRSFPFCSKVFKQNLIEYATKVILGYPVDTLEKSLFDLDYVGVKAAQFSFSRLKGADPVLGVEMASTGETGCIGPELSDAFLKAFMSVGFRIPKSSVFLSTGPIESKAEFLESAKMLVIMGYELYASIGTATFLQENDLPVTLLHWPTQETQPNLLTYLEQKKIDLIINIPKNNQQKEITNGYQVRRLATDLNIPLITDIKIARQMVLALAYYKTHGLDVKAWEEY
ncbi:carbamoyl-phosphate synthase (glutamine-hydrolyzing) large subunit [Candidatus Woesearchaeota archaeon]|nr:carbamoyl-phosphate synthase (glutamine-hydrolyzing) large subunit [Candidatus Woesearchaeota archaeon]